MYKIDKVDFLMFFMWTTVAFIIGNIVGIEQQKFIHPTSTITHVNIHSDSLVKYTYRVKGNFIGFYYNQFFYDKSGKYKIGDTVTVDIKPSK